jgi:hypothetical protein
MPRGDLPERGESTVSRRGFLLSGTTAVAGAAGTALLEAPLASARAPMGDPSGASVNGLVAKAGDGTLVLEKYHLDLGKLPAGAKLPTGPTLSMRVATNARLFRGRPIGLEDYRRGDQIIVYVFWDGGDLVVRGAEPLFVPIKGVVKRRRRNRLKIKKATVRLSKYTSFERTRRAPHATSLDDVSKGDRVFALCWFDVTTREYVADKVGILGT